MNFKCKIYACDEIITTDNVKSLSEYLSLHCIRSFIRFSDSSFFINLYNNLIKDILSKNDVNHIFSPSYDLFMDAYCFLFSHLGKRLNDITKVSKYGVLKDMNILNACCFIITKHIRKEYTSYSSLDVQLFYNRNIDTYNPDYSDHEWRKIDKIIERLNLNEKELKVLNLLLEGKSLSETARTISCGVSTVFDRRAKLQKKYLSLIK